MAHRRSAWVSNTVRGEHQRGAALVEFAIVAPLLFALLFGVVEFGLTFNDSISLRQGVREGARQASVGRLDSCGTVKCTTVNRIGISGVVVRVEIPEQYEKGDPILVCAQKEMSSVTGFYEPVLDGKFLRSKVQMRIERLANPVITEYTSEPGEWAWCE